MAGYKAIETPYKGYRFRSRLEARWAVFFDVMHIEYQYEYKGYKRELEDECIMYLPDFYFPEYKLFGEVKGANTRGEIPKEDAEKISWMIDYNGPCANGVIFLGNIPDPHGAIDMSWAVWKWTGKSIVWGYSIGPGLEGISWDTCAVGNPESAPHYFKEDDDLVLTTAVYGFDWSKFDPVTAFQYIQMYKQVYPIEKALLAARQARFEHGEQPII